MRSRRFSMVAMSLGLVVLLATATSCGASPSPAIEQAAAQAASSPATAGAASPVPNEPGPSVTLFAVGDMMLGRTIGDRILAHGAGVVFDESIATLLASADLTVGNLECAASERGRPQSKSYTFRAPPAALESLALGGFDLVSLANNHALDYGTDALADTADHLGNLGIQAVGAGGSLAAAQAPVVLERGGLKIAFVGLLDAPAEGDFTRENWEAQVDAPGVAWADIATVDHVVSDARRSADVVVAMLHFGFEYAASPSPQQRALAHAAIDAGATVVIGSHPHVLQEVEEYEHGLIAYSLGNFVFDGFDGTANQSAILELTLTNEGVESWELVPVELVDNGLPRLAAR